MEGNVFVNYGCLFHLQPGAEYAFKKSLNPPLNLKALWSICDAQHNGFVFEFHCSSIALHKTEFE